MVIFDKLQFAVFLSVISPISPSLRELVSGLFTAETQRSQRMRRVLSATDGPLLEGKRNR
jgi:hypothetical protein